MHRHTQWLGAALAFGIIGLVHSSAAAQSQTSSTVIKNFEVVSVDGNKVVIKEPTGAREVTVPDGFQFTVDGKQVGVSELKPGMHGSATITTTTTVTPVSVTEVKNGDVMKVTGNSIIVRTPEGMKMFSESDVKSRGVKMMRDGQPLAFSDLHEGDKLTATIVTTHPPKVVHERDVKASLASPAASGSSRSPASPASPGAPATTSAAAGQTARHLPKTASPLPLIGLLGLASLSAGLALSLRRRRLLS